MRQITFNGKLMHEFDLAIAEGRPIDPGGEWTEEKLLAASAVFYRAAVLKKSADLLSPGNPHSAHSRFMRALREVFGMPWSEADISLRV